MQWRYLFLAVVLANISLLCMTTKPKPWAIFHPLQNQLKELFCSDEWLSYHSSLNAEYFKAITMIQSVEYKTTSAIMLTICTAF